VKKILDGLLYDTETASLIGSCGDNLHDLYASSEALYLTKSGHWFVHGMSSAEGTIKRSSANHHKLSTADELYAVLPGEVARWAESRSLSNDALSTIAALLHLPEA